MSNSPEAAWRKYIEIAPTVRRQFLDANYIEHERGKLQQRLRNARFATFDVSIRHGTEDTQSYKRPEKRRTNFKRR